MKIQHTIMKKIKNNGRQGPGKRPTRVPRKMLPPPSTTTIAKKPATHGKPKAHPKPPSAHRMTTRSRAKKFQFMDLPAELRIMVYEKIFSAGREPLSLSNFQLPKTLSWSQTVRSEALSVFFAETTFTATFRSNWCVRNAHWHSPEYMRHHETGVLDLSPLLQNGDLALPKKAVRFHKVDFNVRCVCCIQVIEIGVVQLRVDERKPKVSFSITSSDSFEGSDNLNESLFGRSLANEIFDPP